MRVPLSQRASGDSEGLVTEGEEHSPGGGPELMVRDICLMRFSASSQNVLAFPALLPSEAEKGHDVHWNWGCSLWGNHVWGKSVSPSLPGVPHGHHPPCLPADRLMFNWCFLRVPKRHRRRKDSRWAKTCYTQGLSSLEKI